MLQRRVVCAIHAINVCSIGAVEWDVSCVTDTSSMDTYRCAFNHGLSKTWDVSDSVAEVRSVFVDGDFIRWGHERLGYGVAPRTCDACISTPSSWTATGARGTSAFKQDLSDWDVSCVTRADSRAICTSVDPVSLSWRW